MPAIQTSADWRRLPLLCGRSSLPVLSFSLSRCHGPGVSRGRRRQLQGILGQEKALILRQFNKEMYNAYYKLTFFISFVMHVSRLLLIAYSH